MESHEFRPGARVRIGEGYRRAELRGALGTVRQISGNPNVATPLLVRLDDGRYELFWHHDLHLA
jgi:hypothetical protein